MRPTAATGVAHCRAVSSRLDCEVAARGDAVSGAVTGIRFYTAAAGREFSIQHPDLGLAKTHRKLVGQLVQQLLHLIPNRDAALANSGLIGSAILWFIQVVRHNPKRALNSSIRQITLGVYLNEARPVS